MASDRFFLIVRAPNGEIREVPLGRGAPVVLGRDESADIRVDDKKVSRRHASFKVLDGEPWVEDLGSANGVRLNGKKIDKRARFGEQDQVRVGGYQVTLKDRVEDTGNSVLDGREALEAAPVVADTAMPEVAGRRGPKVIERGPEVDTTKLPVLIGLDDPVKDSRFVLHKGESIVGRLEECDVPILDGSVSRQHARIVYARDRIIVTDLGSSNGIFVNDVRVDMAELAHGDRLRVGHVSFDVRMPPSLVGRTTGPVKTRAKAKPAGRAGAKRWLALGAVGLFLAAVVVVAAVVWRLRKPPPIIEEDPPTLAAGTEPPPGPIAVAPEDPPPSTPVAVAVVVDGGGAEPPPPAVSPPSAVPPSAVPPSAVPPSAVPEPPSAMRVATATSPFGRRGENGLPLWLPPVDASFDFDGFVAGRIEAANVCEKAGDYGCLRSNIAELLARDPINGEAKALSQRADLHEAAQKALARADERVARGEFGEAFRILSEVPADMPQAVAAKKRAEELRKLAIEDELAMAKKEAERRSEWKKAHGRYTYVLGLDPDSLEAMEGLRDVEKKMRKRSVSFVAYAPPDKRSRPDSTEPTQDVSAVILRHYEGDGKLARIAERYARGELDRAISSAQAADKKASGDRKRMAREMATGLSRVKDAYERTRAEISNDPARAWSKLIELQAIEAKVLPRSVKSFLVRELEVSLSEAFAERGASMFDRGRFEEAFQHWEAGYKLDATNPGVRAGLEKLQAQASKYAEEAELASQRGEKDACARWKRITLMTAADSDVHKRARQRAMQTCR